MPPGAARQPRKDAAANRERVLDAATELVRREGEKVPMADIAGHAGVGIGTVYRHFATREDLLHALVHRSFELALANARAAAAHSGPALDGVRAFLAATLRDRDRFVLPLHGGPVRFDPAIRALQAEVRVHLQGLLDRGQAAGDLRADLTPEDLIVSASLLSRPLPAVDDWDRRAGRHIDLLLSGLAARRP
ncbi:TetR/AcrR family transcriptional regulator [Solirubrobacter phytolaccae]|uniref:TetR/AcrR family transcriptional regulator n=1 Tax=Solirubrobacter phytolaccae TaxID=1404360 RepID=A0A9X3N5E3_9ACTN|nr:TetR/AcrR family transcriptional regulator [Solirubrobacter phytolaccae]MDA0179776.1 TetR/AcrR family transcriptional regulator [Solirubrobacter phytolaccae]